MMKICASIAAAMALLAPLAADAQAVDLNLGDPATVAAALQRAGYKAELKKHEKSGDEYILSAANGGPFTVEFYDCHPTQGCSSIQFTAWWKKDPYFNVALANEWNDQHRFLKVTIDKDGDLDEYMDVTAVGRVNDAFFADCVDWFTTMDADLKAFLAKHKPAK